MFEEKNKPKQTNSGLLTEFELILNNTDKTRELHRKKLLEDIKKGLLK